MLTGCYGLWAQYNDDFKFMLDQLKRILDAPDGAEAAYRVNVLEPHYYRDYKKLGLPLGAGSDGRMQFIACLPSLR